MYKDYFHLKEMPFSIAPDPRFLYMSSAHREGLAHLLYGVQGEGGIVLLTGEVGTGKTTLCRCLLEKIHAQCDVAYILNPRMSVEELLEAICDEFHIAVPAGGASVKVLVDAINAHLLQAHAGDRRAVLIIDEAQNLRADVLEQLRLLTNLETNTRKLLQIILIGQPELQAMLRRPDLRQVAQRVVARYHLPHLTRLEVAAYVVHRLRVSGTQIPVIPYSLVGSLYRLTGGVPRLINQVCDRALLGTYVQGGLQVSPKILRKAAREVFGVSARPLFGRLLRPRALFAALCGSGVFAAALVPALVPDFRWALPADWTLPEAVAGVQASPPPAAVQASASDAAPAEQPRTQEPSWPDAMPRALSEGVAFRDLLALYGVRYDPGGKIAPCKAAEAANLRCLHARGGVSDLLRINQPAVLLMDGERKDRQYHAVLTGLGEQAATLVTAGTTQRVRIADMAPHWSGKYVVLWSAPPGYSDTAQGASAPTALWLRQQLARLQGGEAGGPPMLDDELVRRVKAFQLAEGITPDGVPGALTMIRLNLRLDARLPRLSGTLAGG